MGSRAGSFNLGGGGGGGGSNGPVRPGHGGGGAGGSGRLPPAATDADTDDIPFSQAMLAAAPFDAAAAGPLASCNGYEVPRTDDWEGAPRRRGKVSEAERECVCAAPPSTQPAARPRLTTYILSPLTCFSQVFNDPVHGHFYLSALECAFVDTPAFQRLRDLKQLGVSYYVFPGACHNRFEHSLGVAHLAREAAERVFRLQRREVEVDRGDVKAAALAGLCHDLGHGPFSHVFERELLPRAGVHGWHHEDMSVRVFDAILDSGAVPDGELTNDEAARVREGRKSGGLRVRAGVLRVRVRVHPLLSHPSSIPVPISHLIFSCRSKP